MIFPSVGLAISRQRVNRPFRTLGSFVGSLPGFAEVGVGPELSVVLGVVAAVLLVAVLAVRVSVRLGFPSLVLYLAIGVVLGEAGIGIQFENAPLTESLGLAALVLILTEGGLTTRWSEVRTALWPGIVLSTVSVAISIAITGVALHLLLGFDWRLALLWGAVLASTDAAAVFSVLRNVAVSQAARRRAGARVRHERRGRLHRGGAAGLRWHRHLGPAVHRGLRAGRRRRCSGCCSAGSVPRRCAGPRCPPPVSIHLRRSRCRCWRSPPARSSTPPGCSPRTWRRWCSATRGCRTATTRSPSPKGWACCPRSGCSCCSACSCRRAGCSTPWCPAWSPARWSRCWPGRCRWWSSMLPFRMPWREQAFLSWAGLRGAVPIVLAMIPLTEGLPAARQLVDARVRAGHRADAGAGQHPAAVRLDARARPRRATRRRSTSTRRRWTSSAPCC